MFLGIASIGFIATDNAKDIVENSDEALKNVTKAVGVFKSDIDGLIDLAKDAIIKTTLEKLSDEFKYCDPVSSNATKNIEKTILDKIIVLREIINNSNNDILLSHISEIHDLLKERNRICKLNK